ncbi:hypothetical protein [Streptomyces sp. SID2888]|uniref:hypothetical protein n=1 Tax=Streptomyces sp. SID2888 TaxID=2690256 RepID=UPI00137229D2|nr:hypothetical protein [Streptomyces sp. SID2888]MYV45698.1 hypothetical protein [Streptomyces sp. SID2888]
MAVLGFLEWCRQLRALRSLGAADPPGSAPDRPAPQAAGPARTTTSRLLPGTAGGSVLLFGVAVSAQVASGVGPAALTPLTLTVLGVLGAALVTALAAGVGRALRRRSAAVRAPGISGPGTLVDEASPRPGPERGDAP